MGRTKDTTIRRLVNESLSEMKRNQTIPLLRGDLIPEEAVPQYKEMYNLIASLKNRDWKNHKEFVRYKDEHIFKPNESFFMCLFDTQEYEKLFELYEFE